MLTVSLTTNIFIMSDQEFTLEQGLEIQSSQLKEWQKIMKPEIYNKLRVYIETSNNTAKTGNDVLRGYSIQNWISNNLMKD